MITVYTISYNQAILIQFTIDHYRTRFPDCRIVVYDNKSTDATARIALANNCKVISFDTNNQMNDRRHMDIKNNCWKNSPTDWNLMSDLDELLDINAEQLEAEQNSGTTIIRPEAYNMVNLEDNLNIAGIKYGVRDPNYDKCSLFNKKFVSEINYGIGCHECNPIGTILYSKNLYRLFHYCCINEQLSIERAKITMARLCPENIKNDWVCDKPEEIHAIYEDSRKTAIKLR